MRALRAPTLWSTWCVVLICGCEGQRCWDSGSCPGDQPKTEADAARTDAARTDAARTDAATSATGSAIGEASMTQQDGAGTSEGRPVAAISDDPGSTGDASVAGGGGGTGSGEADSGTEAASDTDGGARTERTGAGGAAGAGGSGDAEGRGGVDQISGAGGAHGEGGSHGTGGSGGRGDGGPVASMTDVGSDGGGDAAIDNIDAPRLTAPLSTATVTSQRPTLHWALPSGTSGAHIEICRDRACSNVVTTFDATGSSGRPPNSLSQGVYFWRAYGRNGSTTGRQTSATWQFSTRARSAPVDTSWGMQVDINGDGYGDILIGAGGQNPPDGATYAYLGGRDGRSSVPLIFPGSASNTLIGYKVAAAGDTNGDGFADFVIGAPDWNSSTGQFHLYYGAAASPGSTSLTPVIGPNTGSGFGLATGGAGDLNGDGYGDLVVSALDRVYVYLGGPTDLQSSIDFPALNAPTQGERFGGGLAGGCDINGDGLADFVVGAPNANKNAGRVYVYFGGGNGLTAMAPLDGPDGEEAWFGYSVACAGDLNGDGYADIVVGESPPYPGGRKYYFLGSSVGLTTPSNARLTSADPNRGFGESISGIGDANGDGYDDVLIAGPDPDTAILCLGSATGLVTTPCAQTISCPEAGTCGFAYRVGSSDVNGDGYSDALVGAPDVGAQTGAVYLYYGSPTLLNTASTDRIVAPATGAIFGVEVASSAH